MSLTIKELNIDAVSPIPQVTHQLLEVVGDPRSHMAKIAETIQYDPLITSNVLNTINSAFFGLPRKVDSVHEAIVLMGLDQVVEIVLIKSVAGVLRKEQKGYGLKGDDLWTQSVMTAVVAREIAEKKCPGSKHLIFTGALLKDIGKIFLDKFVVQSLAEIFARVQQKGDSFAEAEKAVLGRDHAHVGGLVAEKWNFSEKLTRLIRHHHLPDKSDRKDPETGIIYLSDTICMMLGIGVGNDGLAYRFHKDVLKRLKVSSADFEQLIATYAGRRGKVDSLLQTM
jgi:HD-like signal output (HDOD) protein